MRSIDPVVQTCPIDGVQFETGGRGRPPIGQVYCSRSCADAARKGGTHRGSSAPRPRGAFRETLHSPDWLRARYVDEQLSSSEIAALVGSSRQTVKWALKKHGIEMRTSGETRVARFDRIGRRATSQADLIAGYGGKCECCGEAEPAFLTLDHRNGGGAAERRLVRGPARLRERLRELGWPRDLYRLLCMNCNFATRGGRQCPHETRAVTIT